MKQCDKTILIPGEFDIEITKGQSSTLTNSIYDNVLEKDQETINQEFKKDIENLKNLGSSISEQYLDSKINSLKQELLGGATSNFDTLKKLESKILENSNLDLDSIQTGRSSDGRIAVTVIQNDGKISQVQVASSNIASTNDLNSKVDKQEGKQLSTEDFTYELKSKLLYDIYTKGEVYTKSEVDRMLTNFKPTNDNAITYGELTKVLSDYVKGNQIATINGNSLINGGRDINIEGSSESDYSGYVSQQYLNNVLSTLATKSELQSLQNSLNSKVDSNNLRQLQTGNYQYSLIGSGPLQFKTINGQNIFGSGNISITSSGNATTDLSNLENRIQKIETILNNLYNFDSQTSTLTVNQIPKI